MSAKPGSGHKLSGAMILMNRLRKLPGATDDPAAHAAGSPRCHIASAPHTGVISLRTAFRGRCARCPGWREKNGVGGGSYLPRPTPFHPNSRQDYFLFRLLAVTGMISRG